MGGLDERRRAVTRPTLCTAAKYNGFRSRSKNRSAIAERRRRRARGSSELVRVMVRARRAEPAANFDRPLAERERHAVDRKERRSGCDVKKRRARCIGCVRAKPVPPELHPLAELRAEAVGPPALVRVVLRARQA